MKAAGIAADHLRRAIPRLPGPTPVPAVLIHPLPLREAAATLHLRSRIVHHPAAVPAVAAVLQGREAAAAVDHTAPAEVAQEVADNN